MESNDRKIYSKGDHPKRSSGRANGGCYPSVKNDVLTIHCERKAEEREGSRTESDVARSPAPSAFRRAPMRTT